MSKLTKVVLINWMYFNKATLPIKGNTAIVGVNGTGKSTIIDAIQMLLLGQKHSKFNSGANAEKRTLESYVRGHVDSDNKEYLRTGDVITYLALEVDVNGKKHIFGINIEYKLNVNKLMDPKYFYIKNCDLDESLFVTDKNYPKIYDDFNKTVKKEYEFFPFPTLLSYQTKIKEVFGLKTDNAYFKILSRAIGLKNITACDKFMNEFVLDEATIDVTDIKNNILEMSKVSETIKREEEKLQSLETIVTEGNQIASLIETLSNLELKKILGQKKLCELKVEKLISENKNYESLVEEENYKKKILIEENVGLNNSKDENNKLLDKIYPDLSEKQINLETSSKQYEENHLIFNTFKTKCEMELSNLSKLKIYNNKIFNSFFDYIKKDDFTTALAKQKFIEFRNEARSLEDSYKTIVDRIRNKLNEKKDELENLKNKIKILEDNKHPFDQKYVDFKKYIKDGLYDKYHIDIEVKFLCEYLDIKDESWRNAIEGYLGAQRFYLIVPNNYYNDALKLYYNNKNLEGFKLINGTKLPDFDFEKNTLGSFVVASNDTALNYARFILNRVQCVENIFELDKFSIAITKDCMCYQNYSTWRIPSHIYKKSFIGPEGLKKQLEEAKKEYNSLNEDANNLLLEYSKNKEHINTINAEEKFATVILEDSSYLSSIDLETSLINKIDKLTEEINFYKSNPQYIDIFDKISRIENDIKNNDTIIAKCDEMVIDYRASIKANNKEIEEENTLIADLKGQLLNYDEININDIIIELNKIKLNYAYITELQKKYNTKEKEIIKLKSALENLMKEARDKFNINCEPKYESLNKFKEEKNKINNSVFKYNTKLIEMQKSHRKLFFSEFLSKLNNSVEQARETIKNLNYSLATFTFGNDYYQIKIGVTENQDLKTIYNYAKEYNSENSDRGIFVDRDVEDRERQNVESLLNKYMFSDDVTNQAFVVDYRNYLAFDVEVHTPDGIKSLNKVIRSQSGGEVQVPFYILSGVAFKQTLDYKRNKDSLGIVLYDEAFDKMDSQRIQSMLQFYRDKLNLQIILAAPGKLDSLVDNIETILAVVRDGEKAIVSDISHEI